ncbi:DUF5959 family protein [Streptomyces sp. NPDC001307]|uniref:DUF5959 family protein n=1 Tax=Streptomyces sp. NPDC001307 TaxID=3364560 RepID=UPI003676F507
MRLKGHGNSVLPRIAGEEERTRPTEADALAGKFAVDTPFVRDTPRTCLFPGGHGLQRPRARYLARPPDRRPRQGLRDRAQIHVPSHILTRQSAYGIVCPL